MNIFYLDKDPTKAAEYMINVHVNKMIIESSQLLANCYTPEQLDKAPKTQSGKTRKYSYYNHPCAIWVRNSLDNFNWTVQHAIALVNERQYRFDKNHFSSEFINWCNNNQPNLDSFGLTPPAQAFKKGVWDHLIDINNPVEAYRRYYVADKRFDKNGKNILQYSKRDIPPFWKQYWNEFYV